MDPEIFCNVNAGAPGTRKGWTAWGNQADDYEPTWKTYANHSQAEPKRKKQATLFDV